MAVTANLYTNAIKHLTSDTNYTSDTINVILCSSAYTPDQDNHEFYSSITNELATANGYTAGGVALGTKSISVDATTNQTRYKAAATTWTATTGNTITARYAIVYKSTGTASTSPLLAYVNFGVDVSATGAAFTITWDATQGAFYIQVA